MIRIGQTGFRGTLRMIRGMGAIFLALAICLGCAAKNAEDSELTYHALRKKVVKGQSTKSDIKHLLGSPGITSRNAQGEEVWTYTRQPFNHKQGSFAGGVVLFGGNEAFTSSSSSSYDLIFTFSKKDVVRDYSVVASQF